MAEGETVVEQSTVLSEEEVSTTLEGTPEEVTTLPSDEPSFEMPEKMVGKSAEEIAKMYVELEKFKASKEETPKEEVDPPKEEEPKEVTPQELEKYNEYVDSYKKNGSLSEDEYAELAKAGYTREQVDAEIDYYNYKQEKALNDVLEPLGGGQEKFKEVSIWANENKTEAEMKEFNEALAGSSKLAQQALLKGLYSEYEAASQGDSTIHTNSPQTTPGKGYANETDFFNDISNPAYKTDKSYVAAVEAKLAKTNRENWSF